MICQSRDIIRRSAANSFIPAPQARDHQQEATKLIDVATCIGCKACQVTCSKWSNIRDEIGHNVGMYGNLADLTVKPWTVMRFSEVKQNDKLEWLIRKNGCMHCVDPGCPKTRPSKGVIIQYANGIVDFQSEQYVGCGYYIADCPLDIPRLSPRDNRVYKCTLRIDHVTIGQGSACVKVCPTDIVHFGSKEDMKTSADERVVGLRTCGYDNANLHDPAGVGGTHVMYVLHHAGKSNLYHGLSENPEISQTVKLWKGIWKSLAAVGFAATFAASIFHYVSVGPNHVEEEEDNLHEEKDEVRR